MKDPHILIARKISGNLSPEEETELESWRTESPDHEDIYKEMLESWQLIDASSNWVIPDKDDVWKKINSHLINAKKSYTRSFLLKVASIAAIFAFAIGLTIPFFYTPWENRHDAKPITVKSPRGQKSEILLPDGTAVWLNSGSTLTYYTNFGEVNRDVELEGEAFFEVAKNDAHEFNVFADGIKVKVLGTAFDVNAYSDNENIEVSLVRGLISLSSDPSRRISDLTVSPDQKVIINKKTLDYNLITCNAEVESIWRLGRMRIENATMKEVVKKMERWYGVNIELKGKEINDNYWFTIKTESLTEMLELINKITPIKYTINGEEVTIQSRK